MTKWNQKEEASCLEHDKNGGLPRLSPAAPSETLFRLFDAALCDQLALNWVIAHWGGSLGSFLQGGASVNGTFWKVLFLVFCNLSAEFCLPPHSFSPPKPVITKRGSSAQ